MNHYWEVTKHKAWVLWYCLKFCSKLIFRCIIHDFSKFKDEESAFFVEFTPILKNTTYGSKEYKECLDGLKPALDHHYSHNSHHPEYYLGGYSGMSSLDRLEMVFDWLSAVKRTKDGDINKSLEINQKRFKYADVDTEWLRKVVIDIDDSIAISTEKLFPEPVKWRRCEWAKSQQYRSRILTGSIGLEGSWSEWIDGRPKETAMNREYEYHTASMLKEKNNDKV